MRILVLAASLTLVACASQPQAQLSVTPAVQTPVPAAAAAPASEAPASVAPAAQVAATTDGAVADPTAEFVPPPGYKRRPDRGEDIYCSKVVVLGSRFPKDDCRTEQQLRDLMEQTGSMRGEMDQRRSVCSGAGACGGN